MIILFFFLSYCYSSCTFSNYNFSESISIGWTIDETNPTPYIDGYNHLILGDLVTETTGNSSVYQDFSITSCNQNFTINFAVCTKDNDVINDQQYVTIKNATSGDIITNIYATLLGFNLPYAEQWYTISCNVCDGTCGGIDISTFGFTSLRLELKVHQAGNLNGMGYGTPTALIVKDVCLE